MKLKLARRAVLLAALGLAAAGLVWFGVWYWPGRHLRTARAALRERDYAAARASLVRHLEGHPDSAEGHLLLAQLDRRANRYADALEHLDEAERLGAPEGEVDLEHALLTVQRGVYNARLDQLCYDHLARADEDRQYLILEALSQGFSKTYRLKEAKTCLDRMLVLRLDSGYALRRRAWIFFQDRQYNRAEADYRRALKVDPEDRVARLGLAQLLLDVRKNGREAARHFERLARTRRDAAVVLGLGRSWRLLGRGADARRLLDKWLADHPTDAIALTDRARLSMDRGATAEAAALLRRAVVQAPYLDEANYLLLLCAERQGRMADAEACQERMRQAKKDREELAALTARLHRTPADPDLRCRIAGLFLRLGQEEEGVRWLRTTLDNYPGHRPSQRLLADYIARHRRPASGGK
jgi:tetratricopeptide (TPR) repeat protein